MAQANPLLELIRSIGATPVGRPSTAEDRSRHRMAVLVHQAHGELIARLAVLKPHRIAGNRADDVDLEARGTHMCAVVAAVSDYLVTIARDTATYSPEDVDLACIADVLSDLESDIAGTLDQAAAKVRDENRDYGSAGRVS